MAANRYTRVNFDKPMSSYTPLPLDTLYAVGQGMQKKYDDNIEDVYKAQDLLATVNAIDEHKPFKKALDDKYSALIEAEAEKAKKGEDTSHSIRKIARQWQNDSNRIEMEKSYADRALAQKEKIKLGSKYQKYNDPDLNFQGANEQGQINPYRFNGINEAQDYQERATKLTDNIASDAFDVQNDVLGEDGIIRDRRTGKESVSSQKVRGIANTLVPNFASTLEGQDYIRKVRYENPNITNDQLGQHLSDYLYNTAAKQIGSKTTNLNNLDVTGLATMKAKAEQDANITTTNEQGNPEAVSIDNVYKDLGLDGILDSKGDYKVNRSPISTVVGGPGLMNMPILNIFNKQSPEQIVNEGYAKLAETSKKLGLPIPKDGDYRKQINNYANNIALQRSTTSQLQQSTIKGMTDFFLGDNSNISNMEVYEQGNENSNAKLTNDMMGSLANNSKITGVDYFGNNKAGWKVAVTPKDGDGKTTGQDKALIAIPKDITFEQETKPVWTVSKGALDFAKTGKIDDKYLDQAAPKLQDQLDKNYGSDAPKIVASSTEKNKKGEIILRGSFVDNSNDNVNLKGIEYNVTKGTFELLSLGEIQKRKTNELQTHGSLRQYSTKLGENIKNSEVE